MPAKVLVKFRIFSIKSSVTVIHFFVLKIPFSFKDNVMQIEKVLTNERLRVSKVS